MSSIANASGASASAMSAAFQQLRIQQARREAERAETVARALQRQAAEAWREADRAEANARALSDRSEQAANEAQRARQGYLFTQSTDRMLRTFDRRLAQLSPTTAEARQPPQVKPPVFNGAGQLTGSLINTTA